MLYELNGVDSGGTRSSMGYATWTEALSTVVILCLAVTDQVYVDTPAMKSFLVRYNKAMAVFKHFDDNDYRSLSHMTGRNDTAHTFATSKPGGPQSGDVWSGDRDDYVMSAQWKLWDAIRIKLEIPSAN